MAQSLSVIEADIPGRLDRLPWGIFHTLIVAALGVTWILDGLEVTLAGSVAAAVKQSPLLHLTDAEVGLASSAYLSGAVLGALLFGWLTDRLGRRKFFFITLFVYMAATSASGLSWNIWSYAFFRFLTGAGIGGEYTAINSTIQEFIPARFRGWTDLSINGSFWIGTAIGAAGSVALLDPSNFGPELGWRLCFLIGSALCLPIFLMRFWIPEKSPRWLMRHGRIDEANAVLDRIEAALRERAHDFAGIADIPRIRLRQRGHLTLREVARTLLHTHLTRTLVCLSLMTAQAFFYNAIFFTYALVLTVFYRIPAYQVGWYVLPFALGNVLGPLTIGRLFDTLGRKPMIAFTYAISGILLIATGYLFMIGYFTGVTQTIAWSIIFFFASAAASSAYLTVSEMFPLEVRAIAIAVFYAAGTGLGGIAAPYLFAALIGTGSRGYVFMGYLLGATLMILAAVVEAIWGTAAEQKPLETVARPLSMIDE